MWCSYILTIFDLNFIIFKVGDFHNQYFAGVSIHMKHIRFLVSIVLILAIVFSSQSFIFSASAVDDSDEVVSVNNYLGDVNLDGAVTAVDARMILQHTAGLIELDENALCYADCNEDGNVSAIDARVVLQITAGLVKPQYPGEGPSQEELREKWLTEISSQVSYDEVSADLKWLVEDIGIRNWWDSSQNNAAEELYKKLCSYGYTSENCEKIEFIHNDITGVNLLATVPTVKENADVLLFVAHYDTVRGTGGAVDNASGTVTLLQMAKIFLQSGKDYGVEIRFLFTAGEEQSYYGSRNYVNSLTDEEKAQHKFVFNIDMSAKPTDDYAPGVEYFLTVSTEPVATDFYFSPAAEKNIGSIAVDNAKALLGHLGEDGYYSPVRAGKTDMIPFRMVGIDALTLSWRCIDAERSFGAEYDLACPPNNHLPEDNMENVDIMSLYNTTRLSVGAAAQLICPYVEEF